MNLLFMIYIGMPVHKVCFLLSNPDRRKPYMDFSYMECRVPRVHIGTIWIDFLFSTTYVDWFCSWIEPIWGHIKKIPAFFLNLDFINLLFGKAVWAILNCLFLDNR